MLPVATSRYQLPLTLILWLQAKGKGNELSIFGVDAMLTYRPSQCKRDNLIS
jgi:hypothetical protein